MNKILELTKKLSSSPNRRGGGENYIPDKSELTSKKVRRLSAEIRSVLNYWEKKNQINGALISVHYNKIVAKSRRLSRILKDSGMLPNQSIRGAKFAYDEKNNMHHVFTHFVSLDALRTSIKELDYLACFLDTSFNGSITGVKQEILKQYVTNDKLISGRVLSQIVNDCYYVNHFNVEEYNGDTSETSIVTLYRTAVTTDNFLNSIGISPHEIYRINDTTLLLTSSQLQLLKSKAPYMISMQVKDLAEFNAQEDLPYSYEIQAIPDPDNEPVVGVIDTLFSSDVYFSKWVDYICMLSPDLPLESADYVHGTAVTSIIVDGCNNNPHLEDGCGRFRVKHFGVCKSGRFSSFSVIKAIREIVSQNPDIKVWNISLGSLLEVSNNYISPEAAELDRLQTEYDVIFIVAGTNKPSTNTQQMKIGAPADSLNSIVVNSVTSDNAPASYSRTGPVLSFFNKPDVSYYGGDKGDDKILVCKPFGEAYVAGTSFAAPWITRKIAYLIYKMGLTREAAKALIIHSATGWHGCSNNMCTIGFGIVPKHINDILGTGDDEIRFIIQGETEEYETYAYDIPVPAVNDKYPFIARATLCYFPECSRDQGVDYTNTELDFSFGRVQKQANGRVGVKSINNNTQSTPECFTYEAEARRMYQKWDNVKHMSEIVKQRFTERKTYGDKPMWGLNIKTKERLATKRKSKLRFATVITLKEMFGKNRYSDFAKLCQYHGWMVNELDIQTRLDIHAIGEQQLEFDLS